MGRGKTQSLFCFSQPSIAPGAFVQSIAVNAALRSYRDPSACCFSRPRSLTTFLVAIYFLGAAGYAFMLDGLHEKIWLRTRLYETALRQRLISIHEVSHVPFGYLGWKLFDSSREFQIERNEFLGLAHFLCEIDESASRIEFVPHPFLVSESCRADEAGSWRVVSAVEGMLWRRNVTLQLLLPCGSSPKIDSVSRCESPHHELRLREFPLSDAEWSAYMDAARAVVP